MTCGDVERLLDAFIDRELPAPMLLEVARHASACPPCDATLRQVATLGDLIGQTLADDAAALDLAPVWPAVARGIERSTRRRRSRRARSSGSRPRPHRPSGRCASPRRACGPTRP